jgi:hypothetical protein
VFSFRGTVPSVTSLGRITFPRTGDLVYVVDATSYYVFDEYDTSWTATSFGPTGSTGYTGATGTSGIGAIQNGGYSDTGVVTSYTTGAPTYSAKAETHLNFDNITRTLTVGNESNSGSIYVYGDVNAANFVQTSDVRYKSDIVTIDNPLNKIRNMRGVYFMANARRKTGVIAQETEVVLPEVVFTDSSAERRKSVDYGNIVGILIEGIKALDERCTALEKSLATR